jgi:large subunit ribosomal protein L15
MKLKKTRKSKRMRGKGMGTHGWGARKKHMGSGHRGGVGMAGSGKMSGHRFSQIISLYGKGYLGRAGFTSKSTKKKKEKVLNLRDISNHLEALKKEYLKGDSLELKEYKILGEGTIKEKLNIKAKSFSESAREKQEKEDAPDAV